MDWGFGGLWRFLTGVLVPDHDGDALPRISGFRRYLNIPKRTPNVPVINYGPCARKRDKRTDIRKHKPFYFVYIDNYPC